MQHKQPMLVIMAAGLGSRYGGLKQMEPVDAQGHLLIDYSIFDAVRAGFSRVICIIKPEMQQDFDQRIGHRITPHVDLQCVYQRMDDLPAGYTLPQDRVKPWGTSHALLCCRGIIDRPFAVINADDYYGPHAYESMYRYLCSPHAKGQSAMVGYRIENTLTEHGQVTRGVCEVSENGMLSSIRECKGIQWGEDGEILHKEGEIERSIPKGTPVSMNFWGFEPEFLDTLYARFPAFLEKALKENPLKAEYLLPITIGELLQEGTHSVAVLPGRDRWFGMTYREDKIATERALVRLKEEGVYPQFLWQ